MSEEEIRYYTPIVLRFGYLHSYWRTGMFSIVVYIITYSCLLPVLGIDLGFHLLADLPYHIGLFLSTLLMVWLVRRVVEGYDSLFDVFDQSTERKLKLYRSINQSPSETSETQKDIHELFKTHTAYEVFRQKIRQFLFNKYELILIPILFAGAFLTMVIAGLEGGWNYHAIIVLPWTQIQFIIFCTIMFALSIFGASFLMAIIGYFRAINLLGTSGSDLRVWNYVEYLRGEGSTNDSFMPYQTFYTHIKTIGQHLSRISLGIILVWILIASIPAIFGLLILGTPPPLWNIFVAVLMGIASLVVFLVPQLQIHRMMASARNAILKCLGKEYGRLKISFMALLRESGGSHSSGESIERGQKMRNNMDMMRKLIQEIRKERTWPFGLQTVLRVITTSLIPIITAIIPTLISLFL